MLKSLFLRRPGELPPRPRTRFRRYCKRAIGALVGVVVGVELLYLVGANLFLALGGLGELFKSTATINVTFRRAWTLWPGRIEARDVRVVFQDHNLEWSLDIARASLGVHWSELRERTFHAEHIRGEGAVFRFRHRVDPASKNDPSVRVLPLIPEFPGTAVFEARVPEAPVTDANYRLWTVHLEDVDVGVREVWIQQFRYVGSGRARGAFRLRPARALWVGPASLELEPGRLTAGTYLLSPGLAGHIDCVVHPFDVRKPDGREVLRFISARVKLRAPGFSPAATELFLPREDVHVRSDAGTLLVDARTDHGTLLVGSKLELEQRHLVVQHASNTLELERATFSARAGPDGRGEARAELRQGGVTLAGAREHPLWLEQLDAALTSSSLDTTRDWSLGEARLSNARFFVPDVRSLNGLSESSWHAARGSSGVVARARYADGELDGEANLVLGDVRVEAADTELAVDGRATVTWSRTRILDLSGLATGSVWGRRVTLRRGASVLQAGGFRIDGEVRAVNGAARGRVTAKADALSLKRGKLLLDARAELRGQIDVWDLRRAAAQGHLDGEFRRVAVHVRDSHDVVRAEHVALSLRIQPGTRTSPEPPWAHSALAFRVAVRNAEFETEAGGGRLATRAAELYLDGRASQRPNGDVDATLHSRALGADAAYGREAYRGSAELQVEVKGVDRAEQTGRVSAELVVRDFSAADSASNNDCPWSSIALGKLRADAELRGPALDPHVRVSGALTNVKLAWGDFSTAATQADFTADAEPVRERETLLAVELHGAKLRSGSGAALGWEATVPVLNLKAELRRTQATFDGPLQVVGRAVSARIGRTPFSADVAAAVSIARLDPTLRRALGTAALRISNLGMQLKGDEVEDWWADVVVNSVDVSAQDNVDLVGTFRAKMRDGLPALNVLASEGELPRWFPGLFPLQKLEGAGTVERRCRLTEVGFEWLKGGPFLSAGRVQSVTDAVRGAFLVRLGAAQPLSAGVKFDDQVSGVTVFAGKSWLKKEYAKLDRQGGGGAACIPTPPRCGR